MGQHIRKRKRWLAFGQALGLLSLCLGLGASVGHAAQGASDLAQAVEELATSALAQRRAPGMVLALVDRQGVRILKGYGLANPQTGQAFHPERTVVSGASVAKTFTALAVLQLHERGLLDLDRDVNAYLRDLQVPGFPGSPLTVRHLLTHTDGFEARIVADALRPGEPRPALREAAARLMPARVLPAGEALTYGSYAANLLGVLVEDLSGQPFEEYIEANLLRPLGMERTSFRWPLPQGLLADLAPGSAPADGGFAPLPPVASRMSPQGGLYTTAADMGRFLQMLLNRGSLAGVRVAQPGTIEAMLSPQFRVDPRLPGSTLGFLEAEHRGQRLLVRDGDGLGTRSRLVVLPSAGLALFFSYNSEDDALREELVVRLLERLFPEPPPSTPLSAPTPARRLGGTYRPLHWDQTTPGKLLLLFANLVRVEEDLPNPGLLRIRSLGMAEALGGFEGESLWREEEPLLYRVVQREAPMLGERVLFREDPTGGAVYLHSGSKYHGTFVRVAWYEAPEFQWLWLALCGAILATALLWLPGLLWALLRGRIRKGRILPSAAQGFGVLVSLLFGLLVLQAFGLLFVEGSLAGIPPLAFGLSPEAAGALNALWVPTLLSLPLGIFALLAWRRRWWRLPGRLHFTLVVLAAWGLTLWLRWWNLLGFQG